MSSVFVNNNAFSALDSIDDDAEMLVVVSGSLYPNPDLMMKPGKSWADQVEEEEKQACELRRTDGDVRMPDDRWTDRPDERWTSVKKRPTISHDYPQKHGGYSHGGYSHGGYSHGGSSQYRSYSQSQSYTRSDPRQPSVSSTFGGGRYQNNNVYQNVYNNVYHNAFFTVHPHASSFGQGY